MLTSLPMGSVVPHSAHSFLDCSCANQAYYRPKHYLNYSIPSEEIIEAKSASSLDLATMGMAFRMVFSNKVYVTLAAAVAVAFWLVFNILDGILLLSPPAFYYPIPDDALQGFALSHVTAALAGMVVCINVYLFRNMNTGSAKTSFLSGSTLGTLSSMCAGCSSVGFYLAATFGTAGVAASTFLSNYQLPLRLLAIGLLIWACYSAHRRITKSCSLQPSA